MVKGERKPLLMVISALEKFNQGNSVENEGLKRRKLSVPLILMIE